MSSTSTVPEARAQRPQRRLSSRNRREALWFLVLALPNIALIILFTYRPLVTNVYYSMLDWTLGSTKATFIGLGNYVEFFTSPQGLSSIRITIVFTVVTVGGAMVLGLLLALALNVKIPGTTLARSAAFAPYVLSGVGVGLVWLFIFDPNFGVLAWFLRQVGLASPQWTLDPTMALVMVIIVYVWKNLGYCAIVYLGGLQSLPLEVMQAASLDGAGPLRRLWSISLPLLSPTTFFLLITTILNSLQAFDILKVMTPTGRGTNAMIFESYLQAFGGYSRAGYSAAISVVLFIMLLVITVVQIRFVEKTVHYA
ncbi:MULTISPECIES: carbohydrate ABC transporter permease [Brachybacterium]|uniref:carbohydrate ABC transporter permease n=1 Tax=Brachybacterium TaxID=43668 RepID=UPI0006C50806|nr:MULTISPECIES: sugar ABC transporter permease [Brachybacterium]MCZ4327293.1 sugar ABC transporter permease [Brachybacterium paraconglomeratum]GAP77382.1 glycerol-3-phosphate ABC transporter, permease protein UgpA [Brachybacterium sp. SW0106-09]